MSQPEPDSAQRSNGAQQSWTFQETIQDFWNTRPTRPRQGGKLGGVATAIGLRYGIDPVLVRVAFVVGAFYSGAGFVLYLLGWLLLPKEGDPGTRQRASGPLAVLLGLLLITAGIWMGIPGLFGLAAGLGALYLLHHHFHDHEPALGGSGHGLPDPATEPSRVDDSGRIPPGWDPLGAAPSAWDLPEPAPSQPEAVPRRRWITLIILVLGVVPLALSLLWGGFWHLAWMLAAAAVAVGGIVLIASLLHRR
jgi:phage shock protein PspC (stress-responsive transcriptional regulator)/nitrate reductase NapE component